MNTVKEYDAIVAEARQLDELEELDEDDAVTGGFHYSDQGEYASAVSELD